MHSVYCNFIQISNQIKFPILQHILNLIWPSEKNNSIKNARLLKYDKRQKVTQLTQMIRIINIDYMAIIAIVAHPPILSPKPFSMGIINEWFLLHIWSRQRAPKMVMSYFFTIYICNVVTIGQLVLK